MEPAQPVTAAEPVDPVVALLRRAGQDGHSWLPSHLVEPVVDRAALAAAVGAGAVVPVGGTAAPAAPQGYALADVAEQEELLADVLRDLAGAGRVAVCLGPAGPARAATAADLGTRAGDRGATGVLVLDDAERLDPTAVLDAAEGLPDGGLLLLAGDGQTLPAPGPGRVLADLAESGVCPVVAVPAADSDAEAAAADPAAGADAGDGPGRGPARLAAALRAGRLPDPDPADRSLVVVPVRDDAQATHRAVQVVTVSIPRAFDLRGDQIAVLTPLRRGAAGGAALAAALRPAGAAGKAGGSSRSAEPWVGTVHDAVGRRWPAVVIVLPGTAAGDLTRALLIAAAHTAVDHVTVVHGAGPDLARAVAGRPHRPRRTRLVALLRAGIGQP